MMAGRRVGIIGAGPAGIMAALEAATLGAQVSLYDTNPTVGRKLLVTGNGRCNISNLEARAERYVTDDPDALGRILARCDPETVLRRLDDLGIPTYATDDGWCYPLSDSAATVAEALAAALDLAGVQVHLQTLVSDVRPESGGLKLVIGGETRHVDRVVVATGGKAHPALGSKGRMFPVLEKLGHTVLPAHPALTAIECDMRPVRDLQGVRMDVGLSIYAGADRLGSTVGNLMFTNTGLSGPAPMDLSYLVSTHQNAALSARIDLLAIHRDALLALLARYREQALPVRVALGAVLPAKVPPVMLALAGIELERTLAETSEQDLERLLAVLEGLELRVRDVRGFQFAQLSTGGVPLAEVNPHTMASDRVPGLYLAGETLNVIGPCGGHNLQFAWATGMLAGRGAAA
jgi:predicted Rossmann fold flavoprotein